MKEPFPYCTHNQLRNAYLLRKQFYHCSTPIDCKVLGGYEAAML